jgi:putative transposase
MRTATKIRLYPTPEQEQKLAVQFGCARWVWNRALSLKQGAWEERGESLSCYALKAMLPAWKQEHPWLKDADSQVLQQTVLNLDRAFQNFFAKRARYPRCKRKHGRQSIQYPQRVKLDGSQVCLPKIGWVSAVVHRAVAGEIKTVTVSRTATGKYFASILAEDGVSVPSPVQHIETAVGVDLGITDIVVTSDGWKSGNPYQLSRAAQNLTRKQRKLSRKQQGSANFAKARLLVAKAHERVRNARDDWQHKVTRRLADENQAVAVEDLAVKNMMQNRHLAKAIGDAGWSRFVAKVRYKLERKGGHLVIVDRWLPSSKTCAVCHAVVDNLSLSKRFWPCASCGTLHDRDVNAAQNVAAWCIEVKGGWADRLCL